MQKVTEVPEWKSKRMCGSELFQDVTVRMEVWQGCECGCLLLWRDRCFPRKETGIVTPKSRQGSYNSDAHTILSNVKSVSHTVFFEV